MPAGQTLANLRQAAQRLVRESIDLLAARLTRDATAPGPDLAPPPALLSATRTLIDFISTSEEFLGRARGAKSEDDVEPLLAAMVAALLAYCAACCGKAPKLEAADELGALVEGQDRAARVHVFMLNCLQVGAVAMGIVAA